MHITENIILWNKIIMRDIYTYANNFVQKTYIFFIEYVYCFKNVFYI